MSLDPEERRRTIKGVLLSVGITLLAAILFCGIYPIVRGKAAERPDDWIGNALGTYGIPTVLVFSLYCLVWRRRR